MGIHCWSSTMHRRKTCDFRFDLTHKLPHFTDLLVRFANAVFIMLSGRVSRIDQGLQRKWPTTGVYRAKGAHVQTSLCLGRGDLVDQSTMPQTICGWRGKKPSLAWQQQGNFMEFCCQWEGRCASAHVPWNWSLRGATLSATLSKSATLHKSWGQRFLQT